MATLPRSYLEKEKTLLRLLVNKLARPPLRPNFDR